MTSASRDLRSHVTDVVTCPICLELFNSPKSLPCLHTFCLKCVEGFCRDKEPGEDVACPVCRQKFKIPENGVQGLVRNNVIAGLVEARRTANIVVVQEPCNEVTLIQPQNRKCDKHMMHDATLHCFGCKMNICKICFAEGHQHRKCQNVVGSVEQIDADMELIKERADGARNEISRLDDEKRKFVAGEVEVGEKILERGQELKQLNDVTLAEFCAPAVTFRPTPFNMHQLHAGKQILVGVVESVNKKSNRYANSVTRVVHTLPEAEPVWGVTSLDDDLYVIRNKAEDAIEVYNTTTTTTLYSLLRHLSVPELKSLWDMTSCKHYRCLYISDGSAKCVHRVKLNGKVTKWSVNYEPYGLSVTSQFTVIVTCPKDSKLLELTTEGKQLREIILQSDIVNPWHAIQLSNGQFVVSHGDVTDPDNRVCIVDTNGHVTQSYGGPRGSATVGQLYAPVHLAVDKDEFIFVVDREGRRVLLLSPTLNFVREIMSCHSPDQFKWKPWRLFLDVDRRRLYVAENEKKEGKFTAGRVASYQMEQVE